MSSPTAAPPAKPDAPPPASDSGFMIRLGVLVGILLVAAAALAYDRMAWAQAKEAYDMLMKLPKDDKFIKSAITQSDIHTALNRKPSVEAKTVDNGTVEEVFQWQRGMPFRTFDITVIYYKGNNDRLIFSTVRSEGIEAGEELAPPPPATNTPPAANPPESRGTEVRPMDPPMGEPSAPMEKTPDPAPEPSTDSK